MPIGFLHDLSSKRVNIFILFLTSLCYHIGIVQLAINQQPEQTDPDVYRDAIQLIQSRGFIAEKHHIITPDGYILEYHRIVNPYLKNFKVKKPILVHHGIMDSSEDWLVNSNGTLNANGDYIEENDDTIITNCSQTILDSNVPVGRTLAFVLASCGFDVWLGNSRGNQYSNKHVKLFTKDPKFWEFSFTEFALIDLPAAIDYILHVSQYPTLGYIGHSQGTLIMFLLLSEIPHYADIIDPFIALAPVVYVGNIPSPLRYLVPFEKVFRCIRAQFPPQEAYGVVGMLLQMFCNNIVQKTFCMNLDFLQAGFDPNQTNFTRAAVYTNHFEKPTSTWDIAHWLQLIKSRGFHAMDHGPIINVMKYGTPTPKKFDIGRIRSTKIALFQSQNDWLADPADVQLLKDELRVPLLDDYTIPMPEWNHHSFLIGKDTGRQINPRVLQILTASQARDVALIKFWKAKMMKDMKLFFLKKQLLQLLPLQKLLPNIANIPIGVTPSNLLNIQNLQNLQQQVPQNAINMSSLSPLQLQNMIQQLQQTLQNGQNTIQLPNVLKLPDINSLKLPLFARIDHFYTNSTIKIPVFVREDIY